MDKKQIRAIAELARLELTAAEEESLARHFEQIKDYFEELSALKIEETTPIKGRALTDLRPDEAKKSRVDINFSPYLEEGLFKVPKVIE